MRSGSGTKSGEPSLLTFSTKSTIAAFGAVSFQEGKGSDWASATAGVRATVSSTATARAAVWRSRGTNIGFLRNFDG